MEEISLRSDEVVDNKQTAKEEQKDVSLADVDTIQNSGTVRSADVREPLPAVRQATEKIIEQHLSPAVKAGAGLETQDTTPLRKSKAPKSFPLYSEYAALSERVESLPDIVHQTFEDATFHITLEGWEEDWFANAEVKLGKRSRLSESKIDFVYTCEYSFSAHLQLD